MSDPGRIEASKERDGPSFEVFFREWHPLVRGELYARGVARQDADDLVSRVFETVHQRWATTDHGRPVAPLLRAIVANHVKHYWRGRARHPEVPTEAMDCGPGDLPLAEELLLRRKDHDSVHRALASLSDEQRAIILAVVCDDRSVAEAARDIGVNENTARSRLRSGVDALRAAFRRIRLREGDR